jgi:hypothetical protein
VRLFLGNHDEHSLRAAEREIEPHGYLLLPACFVFLPPMTTTRPMGAS